MAEFILIEKDKYKIVGTLNNEDINKINAFKNRTTLILDNTVGLSSELVSSIVSDRVVFSIKGGLDYNTKEKYQKQKYVDRTFVSPNGLKKIIKYFEYNESLINPNWNEFEKAMFLYNALVVDMEYAEDYENIQSIGTTERSLNGILYGKLVCAGFAQVYKEMLDRVGIKNYYQNQKDVHAFNIIEIDGKKYGVDVTWDNTAKNNNNGRCGFEQFGQDPEFYTRNGHQIYIDMDISDDFEKTIIKRIYDPDEEFYDLSLISQNDLLSYYKNIVSRINARKPFKYNLQEQPIEIKNKFLPVDTVKLKLKEEAAQEYHINIIINFLKKRNALQINTQLLKAFSIRKNYLMDINSSYAREHHGNFDLSLIGINNYEINENGNLKFQNNDEIKYDRINGIFAGNSTIVQSELKIVYNFLNLYLTQYFNKYISDILKNLDTLLEKYEYAPNDWDYNRAIENGNIYSKLSILVNCPAYLIELGFTENEINNAIQNITKKHSEIHKPHEKIVNQSEEDLDFLYAIFCDLNMIWQTIECDLQKQITKEEFISLFTNVEYMIKILEQYITFGKTTKFKLDEFNVSKEDFQQLLNKIIQDYQKIHLDESTLNIESQNSRIRI